MVLILRTWVLVTTTELLSSAVNKMTTVVGTDGNSEEEEKVVHIFPVHLFLWQARLSLAVSLLNIHLLYMFT